MLSGLLNEEGIIGASRGKGGSNYIRWALGSLKAKAAPGKDGLTAEIVNREVLVDFWWSLANLAMFGNMAWFPQCGRRG